MRWFQQGDVLIQPVGNIPSEGKEQDHNILARGEATGHSHRVHGPRVALFVHAHILYIDAPEGAEVRHEEHRAMIIPAGKYKVGIVREYDHFLEETRKLVD